MREREIFIDIDIDIGIIYTYLTTIIPMEKCPIKPEPVM